VFARHAALLRTLICEQTQTLSALENWATSVRLRRTVRSIQGTEWSAAAAEPKRGPQQRITQFKMPITNNQIVKELTGASFTSLSSTFHVRRRQKKRRQNRQGPNSFCRGAPFLAHLQANSASGYFGLRVIPLD
jgi:hypothetical protein